MIETVASSTKRGVRSPQEWFLVLHPRQLMLFLRMPKNVGAGLELTQVYLNPGAKRIESPEGSDLDTHELVYQPSEVTQLMKRAFDLLEISPILPTAQFSVFAPQYILEAFGPALQQRFPKLVKRYYPVDYSELRIGEIKHNIEKIQPPRIKGAL